MGLVEALGLDSSCVPLIATPFGGGMGRYGEVCGAITGAMLALGLKSGRTSGDDTATRNAVYAKVVRLIRAFEIEYGSSICRAVTKCDLLAPEGQKRMNEEKLHENLCTGLVAFGAEEGYKLITE